MITDKFKTFPDDHLLLWGLDYCYQCNVSLGSGWPGGCHHDKWSMSEHPTGTLGTGSKLKDLPKSPKTASLYEFYNTKAIFSFRIFFYITSLNYFNPTLPLLYLCYKFAWILLLAAPWLPLHYQAKQLSAKFLAFSTVCPWTFLSSN